MKKNTFKIENFGPIMNVEIELKKINIIAGVNGSGKSTISKLLYCLLESDELLNDLTDKNIHAHHKKGSYKLDLKNEFENVIYIDSTPVLDFNNSFNDSAYHLKELSRNLKLTNQISNQKTDELKSLIGGYIYYNGEEFLFKTDDKEYRMKNTASGVKQIGIIQILLSNGVLKENSFLIIDGVEVNIHPEWQVKLAEILVLLVKDLNVNLFINTHSAEFIEAIEVYSTKYYLKNETKYYLSEKDENSEKYNIKEVSQDKLYEIYNNLGDSYDILDIVRGKNIAKHLWNADWIVRYLILDVIKLIVIWKTACLIAPIFNYF